MTVERNQQRDLQEAQTEHQVVTELGRERIVLVEGGLNPPPGFTQPRVVDSYIDITAFAPGQCALQNRLKQISGLPLGAGMQFVVGAPILLLTAWRPNGARQGAAAKFA